MLASSNVAAEDFAKFLQPSTLGLGRVIQPYFTYGLVVDDNIMRIRKRSNPNQLDESQVKDELLKGHKSDITNRFVGGVLLNKEFGRQRFTGDLNWAYNKFERFSDMSQDFKNAAGSWNWVVGKRLEGNVGVTYNESLMPFLFQPGAKILRTQQTQFVNGVWTIHPRWRFNGEYLRYDQDIGKTDLAASQRARNLARTENRFEGGIDYVTYGRNTVGVLFRYIIGDFSQAPSVGPDGIPISSDFDQKEVMGKVSWAVTEKSHFLVTGGWVERLNKSLKQRNFSGFNARGIYTWKMTEKLGFSVNGWRITSAMGNLTANFSLNTGVSVHPYWQITEKIRFEGDLSYEKRKFDRLTALFDNAEVTGTKNTFRNVALRAVYLPHPSLVLSTSIFHSDLSTDAVVGGFNANGVTANLQYVYGKR
ncbi:exopolysaccharide biosynthesis operon protein EpsL [Nitrosomonas sp. PY1]|uniref:hypothetical protein n=1 Tax=Nitrosomonas sp. PY1 TaxID=1803906 RepID=UPI001FC7BF40|nr:hypothetical protein [Nitrosomonas sp. PY1]GKS68491.1 exopolysaccharide biosynthesis operon protein EpsL [Nitrosomonas sp. PY1]